MGYWTPIIDGVQVPSVTKIIGQAIHKEWLVEWYGKHGTKHCKAVVKKSTDFGTDVHNHIEAGLNEKFFNKNVPKPTLSKRQHEVVETFWQWQAMSKFTPVATELHVVSRHYRYGGTFDAVGHFTDNRGQYFILDWKTSKSISREYGMQLAAYAQAYYEQTGKLVDHGGVIRLEKLKSLAPQIEIVTFNFLRETYLPIFLHCREIWDFVKKEGAYANT